MLNDFFQSLQFEFPWERFVTLPRHPAYRYQYRGGKATISGNPRYYQCVLSLEPESPVPVPPPAGDALSCFFSRHELFKLSDADWNRFPPVFAEAFRNPPPLIQLSEEQRLAAARALLDRTRNGGDGPLVKPASFTISDRETGELQAAILITLIPPGDLQDFSSSTWHAAAPPNAVEVRWGRPHLTWIFVAPGKQRHQLGTVLLRESVSALKRLGYAELASTFLLGDHISTLWHWRNGFQLLSHPASPRLL